MRISFLHTIGANQALFDSAAIALGISPQDFRHETRTDLREAVETAGGYTAALKSQTIATLLGLAAGAEVVLVTCATLGPITEMLQGAPAPILRADEMLVNAAVDSGGKITVLCAVEASVAPLKQMYERHMGGTAREVSVICVPYAWQFFKEGNTEASLAAIAASANAAYAAGADTVALAHPWMAPAAQLVDASRRPLDIPSAAIRTAAQRCRQAGT